MWISALLGMMTIYAETVLGMKYRKKKDKNGKWLGGAMYYIEYGLKCKPLAIVFAIACVLASFGMGNMAQAKCNWRSLTDSFWRKYYNYGCCCCAGCIYCIKRRYPENCKSNGKSSAYYGGYLSFGRYHCHCGTWNDASKCVWSNFLRRV